MQKLLLLLFTISYLYIGVIDAANEQKFAHLRAKRDWLFDSSRQNADKINSFYQDKSDDGWYKRHIENPFARYFGRAWGDEFPEVRDSIIDHQKSGKSFFESHMPWTGYHPGNWNLNEDNDAQEEADPYNGFNQYK